MLAGEERVEREEEGEDGSGDEEAGLRAMVEQMLPAELAAALPAGVGAADLWRLVFELVAEPPHRSKLPQYNTLDDALALLRDCKNIVVLTGAGVSVSCGIPDFRSKDGVYSRLHRDYPDLPNPEAMFDIQFFKRNPKPFFDFAKEIYPGQFKPSLAHRFVKFLEERGKLLRNYTQNIDTLEQVAGIENVVQCHGSFATASCCNCQRKVSCDEIRSSIMNSEVPYCSECPAEAELAVMKPDIVFFGESLPSLFHDQFDADQSRADLLVVIGTSLKVRPVALIPHRIPAEVPVIVINRDRLCHLKADIELLGLCDDVLDELCRRLGAPWNDLCTAPLDNGWRLVDAVSESQTSDGAPEAKRQKLDENGTAASEEAASSDELLPERCFVHAPPNRYVFKGADVNAAALQQRHSAASEDDDGSSTSSPSSSSADDDDDAESTQSDGCVQTRRRRHRHRSPRRRCRSAAL